MSGNSRGISWHIKNRHSGFSMPRRSAHFLLILPVVNSTSVSRIIGFTLTSFSSKVKPLLEENIFLASLHPESDRQAKPEDTLFLIPTPHPVPSSAQSPRQNRWFRCCCVRLRWLRGSVLRPPHRAWLRQRRRETRGGRG